MMERTLWGEEDKLSVLELFPGGENQELNHHFSNRHVEKHIKLVRATKGSLERLSQSQEERDGSIGAFAATAKDVNISQT